MLFGREMRDGHWRVVKEKGRYFLQFERDPFMYKKIPCSKLIRELYKNVEDDYNRYFFYVFADKMGKPEFIFVSISELCFSILAYSHTRDKPDEEENSANVAMTPGALFDIRRQSFVKFIGQKDIFYEFVIYDSDVPHVVYDEIDSDYSYVIYHNGGLEKTAPCVDPEFFSYVSYSRDSNMPEITRGISYETYENGVKNFIIIQDGISIVRSLENVEIAQIISIGGYENSALEYLKTAHMYDDFLSINSVLVDSCYFNNWHMAGGDILIMKDMTSTLNELGDFFIISLNGPVVDLDHGFFNYKIENNSLRVLARRNDFENVEMIYDFSAKKFVD